MSSLLCCSVILNVGKLLSNLPVSLSSWLKKQHLRFFELIVSVEATAARTQDIISSFWDFMHSSNPSMISIRLSKDSTAVVRISFAILGDRNKLVPLAICISRTKGISDGFNLVNWKIRLCASPMKLSREGSP